MYLLCAWAATGISFPHLNLLCFNRFLYLCIYICICCICILMYFCICIFVLINVLLFFSHITYSPSIGFCICAFVCQPCLSWFVALIKTFQTSSFRRMYRTVMDCLDWFWPLKLKVPQSRVISVLLLGALLVDFSAMLYCARTIGGYPINWVQHVLFAAIIWFLCDAIFIVQTICGAFC